VGRKPLRVLPFDSFKIHQGRRQISLGALDPRQFIARRERIGVYSERAVDFLTRLVQFYDQSEKRWQAGAALECHSGRSAKPSCTLLGVLFISREVIDHGEDDICLGRTRIQANDRLCVFLGLVE